MRTKVHTLDMTKGPLAWPILRFSIPLLCSNVLQVLFNMADVAVVGRFAGDNSLAAVGSTTSLVNLMVTLFLGYLMVLWMRHSNPVLPLVVCFVLAELAKCDYGGLGIAMISSCLAKFFRSVLP